MTYALSTIAPSVCHPWLHVIFNDVKCQTLDLSFLSLFVSRSFSNLLHTPLILYEYVQKNFFLSFEDYNKAPCVTNPSSTSLRKGNIEDYRYSYSL
jgi:hypothetical protein